PRRLALLPVPLDAHPSHLAPLQNLRLTDGRDVILGVTGSDARLTAGAAREVDRHRPLRVIAGVVAKHGLPVLGVAPPLECLDLAPGVFLLLGVTLLEVAVLERE